METVYGYLERITFCNEENHFTVAKIKEKGKRDFTTIVGNLAGISPGVSLKLQGKWVHNKKFGEQFVVERFETVVPATVNGIEKYLGSGLIKGIGPVMAKRMVKVYGLDTLSIIENSPERLSEVEGIGLKRIGMITDAWEEQKEVKDIMLFLQDHGVSATYSAKIFRQYGKKSIEVLKDNPYRLAADIRGIGFIIADKIAQKLGMDPASIYRAEESLIYVLMNVSNEGHVYYPYELLAEKAYELLNVDKDIVTKAVASAFEKKRIRIEDLTVRTEDEEVINNKAVYLPYLYNAEKGLARRLLSLKDEALLFNNFSAENSITQIERSLEVKLADKQREAILSSALNKVMVITGGPGTGKTTIVRSIVTMFKDKGLKVLLAAPTGRAAKRMSEATGNEARTIHRLLEFSPKKMDFQKNEKNPLNCDLLIVDEASMIDIRLMYSLTRAIPLSATFIMVGDIHQLPSVGPGNVLRDIIDSGMFEVVELNEIFRQSRESKIITNAHRINSGNLPDTRRPPQGVFSDFYFISEEEPEKVVSIISEIVKNRLPKRFGYNPVEDIQVLTPMHRGVIGVANLNAELQNLLNPGGQGIAIGSRLIKINDKVMQLENNYDKEVYNGDIGRVRAINREEREVRIVFDDRLVTYDFTEMDELALAYAVSIHKSQGSEYPVVIIPVMTQHFILLQRNLIYTAVTRGKKMVILVGTKKALAIAVKNNKTLQRYSRLRERLIQKNLREG